MASVSTYLDTRRAKKSGEYPLKFNISINRGKKFLVNLNIDVLSDQWNGLEIVKHPRRQVLNQYIRMRTTQIEDELIKLETTGHINTMTVEQIKVRIDSVFSRSDAAEEYLVQTHWEYFLTFKDKRSTRESYQQTLLKISTFTDLRRLTFKDITSVWLRDFEQYTKIQGLAINSTAIHMRNIRAVFNDAINTDKISQNDYPFRKYKIKNEKTVKRSLSIQELQEFRDFHCEPHQVKYRDLFMLIFYMQGINMVDLLNLKSLDNGRANFKRAKTGRLYSIKIEPEAMAIIGKYRGREYMLDVCDNYGNYKDFLHRMNNNLQEIGPMELVTNGAKDPKHVKKNKKSITPLFPKVDFSNRVNS